MILVRRQNMKERRNSSISKQIRPFLISVLTAAAAMGTTLFGIGEYLEGAITIVIGCLTSIVLALVAKLLDSI
jgi:hypothetical protein